jgi:hypothetical protein
MSFIEKQWASPDEEFVRMAARGIYEGKLTTSVVETFKPIVHRAFNDLFRQRAKARLDVAFDGGAEAELEAVDANKIETTPDELQGFMIVRAIAAEVVPVSRIVMRDAQSYCAVLFDDNNRKPIIRLHFSQKQKFVTTFENGKEGARSDIDSVEAIFTHRSRILAALALYMA